MAFEEDYSFDNYKNLSGSVVEDGTAANDEDDGEIKKSYKISKDRKSREELSNEMKKEKSKRKIIMYPIGLIMVSVAAYLTFDGIKTNNELNNLKNVNESTVSISPFEKNIGIDKTIDKSINVSNVDNKEGEINKEGIGIDSSLIENKKEKMSIEDKIESKVSIEVIKVNNNVNKDNKGIDSISKEIKDNKGIKESDEDLLVNLKSKESKNQKEYTINNVNEVEGEIEVVSNKERDIEVIGVNSINKEIKDNDEDILKNLKSKESKNQKEYIINNDNKGEDEIEVNNSKSLIEYKNESKNKELVIIRENALNHISINKEEVTLKYFFNSECYNSEGMIYKEKGSFKGEDIKVLGFNNNDKFYYYKNSNGDICKTEKGNIKNESIKVNNETIKDNEEVSFSLIDTKNDIKNLGKHYEIPSGVKYKCFATGEDEVRGNTSSVIGIKDGEEIIFVKGEDVCITDGFKK